MRNSKRALPSIRYCDSIRLFAVDLDNRASSAYIEIRASPTRFPDFFPFQTPTEAKQAETERQRQKFKESKLVQKLSRLVPKAWIDRAGGSSGGGGSGGSGGGSSNRGKYRPAPPAAASEDATGGFGGGGGSSSGGSAGPPVAKKE